MNKAERLLDVVGILLVDDAEEEEEEENAWTMTDDGVVDLLKSHTEKV